MMPRKAASWLGWAKLHWRVFTGVGGYAIRNSITINFISWMKLTMENVKTLWELLQLVVEQDDDRRYSLHEFLLESTEEDRKRIEGKLTDADCKQFYEYMDGYTFVNKTEVEMAVSEYLEHVNQRPLCMWEMGDVREIVEDYIDERNLKFDEDGDVIAELPF